MKPCLKFHLDPCANLHQPPLQFSSKFARANFLAYLHFTVPRDLSCSLLRAERTRKARLRYERGRRKRGITFAWKVDMESHLNADFHTS